MLLVHSRLLGELFVIGNLAVIRWCMDRFKMPPSAVADVLDLWVAASKHLSTTILDLGVSLGFRVPAVSCAAAARCLEAAARLGQVHNLDWWLQAFPDLTAEHFNKAVDAATSDGQALVLTWIKEHGLLQPERRPDPPSLIVAAKENHVDVLDWFAPHPPAGSTAQGSFPASVFLAAAKWAIGGLLNGGTTTSFLFHTLPNAVVLAAVFTYNDD